MARSCGNRPSLGITGHPAAELVMLPYYSFEDVPWMAVLFSLILAVLFSRTLAVPPYLPLNISSTYSTRFQVALPSARRSCNQHRGDQEVYTSAKAGCDRSSAARFPTQRRAFQHETRARFQAACHVIQARAEGDSWWTTSLGPARHVNRHSVEHTEPQPAKLYSTRGSGDLCPVSRHSQSLAQPERHCPGKPPQCAFGDG